MESNFLQEVPQQEDSDWASLLVGLVVVILFLGLLVFVFMAGQWYQLAHPILSPLAR